MDTTISATDYSIAMILEPTAARALLRTIESSRDSELRDAIQTIELALSRFVDGDDV